ncbi:MAG: alpha/beta fold hydrolase [Bdellovibrionota bacterium]
MPFLLSLILLSTPLLADELHHELISGKRGKVEIYWQRPDGTGPFPALILVHGHQGHNKVGAENIAMSGYFPEILKKGFVAIAVSQSGYGKTEGAPDNCGETSQEALKAAIQFARQQKFIVGSKIALAGSSMGASLSALIASQDEKLAGAIVSSGIYDQKEALLKLGFYARLNGEFSPLQDELQNETQNRYDIRSALSHAEKIKIPLLIMTGLGDQIAPPDQSLALHKKIQASGGKSRLVIFPFAGHSIHPGLMGPEINKFLEEIVR